MDGYWKICREKLGQQESQRKMYGATAQPKRIKLRPAIFFWVLYVLSAAAVRSQSLNDPFYDSLVRYVYVYDYKGVEYSTLSTACDRARVSIQDGISASYPPNQNYTLIMHPYSEPALSVSISDKYALYNCQAFFQLKFFDKSVHDFEFNEQVARKIRACRIGHRLTAANELCERLERVPQSIWMRMVGG